MREQTETSVPRVPISSETLAGIVLKARAYDAIVQESDPDESSNAVDDRAVSALEDQPDNPVRLELAEAIESLSDGEQTALVALVWIGRGDLEGDAWDEAVELARERRQGSTTSYLLGIPLLGDYLAEGAAAMNQDVRLSP